MANQMDDSSLFVGFVTKQTLRKLFDDGDIADSAVDKFYKGVRMFISYHLLRDTDIPLEVWAEAKVGEDEETYYQIDIL